MGFFKTSMENFSLGGNSVLIFSVSTVDMLVNKSQNNYRGRLI